MVASRVGAVQPLETINQRNRVVGNSFRLPCSDSDDSGDDLLSVGTVWPLTTAVPLGGTRMVDDCRLQADSLDDVLSVGAWASENRHGMCCARLDDFDWVVPPYDPEMILPGQEMDMEIPDVNQDICVLPDEFPVVVDRTAVEPLFLPVVVETRPQVGCDPDLNLSERYVEVDIYCGYQMGYPKFARRGSGNGCEMAAVPMTLPVDEEPDSQVEEGPDVVWTGRDMDMGDPDVDRNIHVLTDVEVVPFVIGGSCPMGWLDSESDDCEMDEIVLVPEISPIVSMKNAVVPTFLPALSEVCSLAVLAGGGGVVAATAPLAMVE